MKQALVVFAILAAVIVVAAPSSSATTSPGYNFRIQVTVTDNDMVMSRSVAKRGWLAHFVITNKGHKTHVFDVGGLKRRSRRERRPSWARTSTTAASTRSRSTTRPAASSRSTRAAGRDATVTRRTVGVLRPRPPQPSPATAAGATTAGWPQPNGDLGGTRAVSSPITARTVAGLRVRWRYPLTRGSTFGTFASTPVVVGETVYVQDLSSSVTAIDLRTGARRWQYLTQAPNDGPNGLAVSGGRIFTRDRHERARTRPAHRQAHLGEAARQPVRAVRRHRAARRTRARLHLDDRARARRARRAVCARPAHREGPLALRHDPRPVEVPVGGRRRRVVPALARPRRTPVLRHLEPRPVGRLAHPPERRHVPRPDAVHRRTRRAGRDEREAALVRPGDEARRARLRPRGVADRRRRPRLRRRQGGAGRRMGPRQRQARVVELGRHAPARPRPAALDADEGVPRPVGRRAHTDGLRRRPPVRARRRALHDRARERPGSPGESLRRRRDRRRARRRRPARSSGRTASARRRPDARPSRRDVVFVPTLDGRVQAFDTEDGRRLWETSTRAGINGCPSVAGATLLVGAGAPLANGKRGVPELSAYTLPGYVS